MIQKNGLDVAMPFMLMKVLKQMKDIDPETRKRKAKVAMEFFPESKKLLSEWRNNIDEVL